MVILRGSSGSHLYSHFLLARPKHPPLLKYKFFFNVEIEKQKWFLLPFTQTCQGMKSLVVTLGFGPTVYSRLLLLLLSLLPPSSSPFSLLPDILEM